MKKEVSKMKYRARIKTKTIAADFKPTKKTFNYYCNTFSELILLAIEMDKSDNTIAMSFYENDENISYCFGNLNKIEKEETR